MRCAEACQNTDVRQAQTVVKFTVHEDLHAFPSACGAKSLNTYRGEKVFK